MKQYITLLAAASALSSLSSAQFHRHNHGHGHLHKRDMVYETHIETKVDVVQTTVYVPEGGGQEASPAPAVNSPPPANPPSNPGPKAQAADVQGQDSTPQQGSSDQGSSQQSPEQIQQGYIQQQENANKLQEQKNQQQVQYNNQQQQNPGQQSPPPPQPSYPQAPASAAAPAPAPSSGGSSGGDSSGPAGGGPTKTSTVSFYYPEQGGQKTSCEILVKNSDPGVALPGSIMNANKSNLCGKKISVTWNGKQMSFPIVDTCPGCDLTNRIDLTVGSFTQNFAPTGTGVVQNVQWSLPS